jgi:hypothetical protein
MKLRTTLAVLLLGLLAWLAIRHLGPTKPTAPAQTPLVGEELLAQWDSIDLHLLSGSDLKILREPGKVEVQFGSDEKGVSLQYKDLAERPMVARLLDALRESRREPLTGSRDDLLRAGLDPPRYRVVLHGAGRQLELDFGENDSGGSGILAVASDDPRVFRTGRAVADLLDHNLREWRKQTVFDLDPLAVSRIELVRYADDPDQKPETIVVERQTEPNTWRFVAPRSMPADPGACLSLAQQASLLRVDQFIHQVWDKPITDLTRLPDHPKYELTLTAGTVSQHVLVGALVPQRNWGFPVCMESRDPQLCFSVPQAGLEPIVSASVASLRPKRLFPHVESSLVALQVARPAAGDAKPAVVWDVERENHHPRGAWKAHVPFEGKVNEGAGDASFAQVVVDVDRLEVEQFLPADPNFKPEGVLTLSWRTELERRLTLEFARDGKKTRARDPKQPDDLFVLSSRLGALLDLDLELYRDRQLFPKDFAQKLVRWRLVVPDRAPIEVVRKEGALFPESAEGTDAKWSNELQGATGELLGAVAAGYARGKSVLAQSDAKDPFAAPQLELTLVTADGEESWVVGSDAAAAPAGLYCKVRGRLPDDVWVVVPRAAAQKLIELGLRLPKR